MVEIGATVGVVVTIIVGVTVETVTKGAGVVVTTGGATVETVTTGATGIGFSAGTVGTVGLNPIVPAPAPIP